MSLEEAEKKMNSRGTVSRLAAGSKLGALAAKGIPPPLNGLHTPTEKLDPLSSNENF